MLTLGTSLDILGFFSALCVGAAGGIVSMLAYAKLSPQGKLKSIQGEMTDLRHELESYDGDFTGAMVLARQNLWLELRRLGCVLGPSFLAGVPVLAAFYFVGDQYIAFFVATLAAALTTKTVFRIT